MDTKYIILAFIIIIIVVIIIVVIWYCSNTKKDSKVYKLVKFSGLFSNITNLNIGHSSNAPIFQARPWLGEELDKGLDSYMGIIQIPKDKSLYIKFPKNAKNYEVIAISYPSWELIDGPMFEPGLYELCDVSDRMLILITGIGEGEWLDQAKVYYSNKSGNLSGNKTLPVVDENKYINEVNIFYDLTVGEYLKENNLELKDEISSQIETLSFPLSSGIVTSIAYKPKSLDETIFIVYPNRKYTTGIESAIYLCMNKKKIYLKQEDVNSVAGIYSFTPETLDDIYIEERLLVSKQSRILPFNIYLI